MWAGGGPLSLRLQLVTFVHILLNRKSRSTVALLFIFSSLCRTLFYDPTSVKCHEVVKHRWPERNLHIINTVNAHVWKLFHFLRPEIFLVNCKWLFQSKISFKHGKINKGKITSELELVHSLNRCLHFIPSTVKNTINLWKSQHSYFCECHECCDQWIKLPLESEVCLHLME